MLLINGADVNVENKYGHKPINWITGDVRSSNHRIIVLMLNEYKLNEHNKKSAENISELNLDKLLYEAAKKLNLLLFR